MTLNKAIAFLERRMRRLRNRIECGEKLGKDFSYDKEELSALENVLSRVRTEAPLRVAS